MSSPVQASAAEVHESVQVQLWPPRGGPRDDAEKAYEDEE